MKGGYTPSDWDSYSNAAQTKSQAQTFARQNIKTTNDPRTSFDPTTIAVRESRDSALFPQSTPLIIGFDVTGTMGDIPYYFVQEGLRTFMAEIYDRKPVSDPQIMCAAIGDVRSDRAPLQVTQFEVDLKIAEQLEDLYLEGNGGGNNGESYNVLWYFAATKTSTDNFEKRGKKGILITIGDEPPVFELTREEIKQFIGGEPTRDYTSAELLEMVRKQYDVYHIIVEQGSGFHGYGERAVVGGWTKLLGEGYVIRLSDYTKLAEVGVSLIQRNAGMDRDTIVKSWDGKTALVVANALPTVPVRGGARKSGIKLIGGPKAA